jgi:hypothetical protein
MTGHREDEHGRDEDGTYREVCFWADCNHVRHAAYCERPEGNPSQNGRHGGKCFPWKQCSWEDHGAMIECSGFKPNPEWKQD